MNKILGYIGYNCVGEVILGTQGNVLLFPTVEAAKAARAVRTLSVIPAHRSYQNQARRMVK